MILRKFAGMSLKKVPRNEEIKTRREELGTRNDDRTYLFKGKEGGMTGVLNSWLPLQGIRVADFSKLIC